LENIPASGIWGPPGQRTIITYGALLRKNRENFYTAQENISRMFDEFMWGRDYLTSICHVHDIMGDRRRKRPTESFCVVTTPTITSYIIWCCNPDGIRENDDEVIILVVDKKGEAPIDPKFTRRLIKLTKEITSNPLITVVDGSNEYFTDPAITAMRALELLSVQMPIGVMINILKNLDIVEEKYWICQELNRGKVIRSRKDLK
jgi:hypothetical protein